MGEATPLFHASTNHQERLQAVKQRDRQPGPRARICSEWLFRRRGNSSVLEPFSFAGRKPPVCGTFSVRAVSRPPYVRRWGRSWPDIGVIGHQDLRLAAVCVRGTPRPFVPPRALAYGFGGTAKQGCCLGIGQPAADFGVDHRVAPQQAPGRARTRPVAGANKAGQRGERCPSI